MAIIKCPQCGKEVSNRTQKCPRCNTVLIKAEEKEKISVETVKTTAKENIINVALSTALVFIAFSVVCSCIARLLASTYLGDHGLLAVQLENRFSFSNKILILIWNTAFFCVLPLLFKNKPDMGYVSGIILTFILSILCYYICGNKVSISILQLGRPDLYSMVRTYGEFNGLIIPLLHGSLAIMSYGKSTKKFLLHAIITLIVFFIIDGIGSFLTVSVFSMGITGIALVRTLGSLLIFVFTIVKSNEMKNLLKKA